jgi:hypothetical protein
MNDRIHLRRAPALVLGATLICGAATSFAFDMGNMMNPSKWMGGGNDRDDYDEGPWGGPGYGWGGPGGYGGPGYGYGGPGGYGRPDYGYGAPADYGSAPGGAEGQPELDALRQRVRELEGMGVR